MTVKGFNNVASLTTTAKTAEQENPSYLRELAAMCEELWNKLRRKEQQQESHITDKSSLDQDKFEDPYKAFWWRRGLGDQVYDCGDRVVMSGTRNKPVTDIQIMRMVAAAQNRKDPPWETLYAFDKKGKPDLAMAHRVQGVINTMRAQGMIPPECKIAACLNPDDYPSGIKKFSNFLSDKMNAAARDQQGPAAPHAGLRTAASTP
jgi:hypothetical protein